ncbi:hypothetical protein GR138_17285 [Shinella kummerowiae]|uniref:Uncharacterized protein n=1 Tax=Shinella kummerowiae TaxID=417745 RepID=A0A6N8SJG5_9HYPH|nr:hypothetical protein [Shinella kummerowiae]MXN46950.1 hypothetical protein [Shinella kummerowiae]
MKRVIAQSSQKPLPFPAELQDDPHSTKGCAMIDAVLKRLPSCMRLSLSDAARPGPIVLCLITAALLLTAAIPARSASDEIICELTADGVVKCRKPRRIGGDPTPLNKDDLPEWLTGKAGLDAATKVQAK